MEKNMRKSKTKRINFYFLNNCPEKNNKRSNEGEDLL